MIFFHKRDDSQGPDGPSTEVAPPSALEFCGLTRYIARMAPRPKASGARAYRGCAILSAVLLLGSLAAWGQEEEDETPCPDLVGMARKLQSGADNCDNAVAQGLMSSCQVSVPFSLADIPGLSQPAPSEVPWLTSPASARRFAADLRKVRCVESLYLETDPAQPQPGEPFTIRATVTMADDASPEGLAVSLSTESTESGSAENEAIANESETPGQTRISRKAAAPTSPTATTPALSTIIVRANGVGEIPGFDALLSPGPRPSIIVGSISRDQNKNFYIPEKRKWKKPLFLPPGRCALQPNESVIDRFYDGTRLGDGFLDKHEGVKPAPWAEDVAHTEREHIPEHFPKFRDNPAMYLRSRGKQEASAYDNQETAEAAIRDSIVGSKWNRLKIVAWLYGNGEIPRRLRINFRNPAARKLGFGISLKNPAQVAILNGRSRSILILEKKTCRIVIYTSYPDMPAP